MSRKTSITGEGIRDETVASADIASGSIKAGELNAEAISGQTLITSTDTTNDRLLIWDATDSNLKQVSPGNLGVGGGGGSPAGADTQIQFNDGGSSFGASSNLTFDDTTLTVSTTGLNPIFNLAATNDGASASPIFTLKRNSSSPADADYLGQIKFQGENDADQELAYAKITGKIDDASDGSEDGILEFANVKAGSQTITARLKSNSLQLLNSTNLSVDGTAEISNFLYHKDDNDTFIKFEDDDINFQAGGVNFIDITQGSTNEITFNEAGADVDFRVEGDNNTHLLYVSGGSDRVGIGTASPATTFHAYADVSNAYVATIDNDQSSGGHVLKLLTDGNGSGSRLLEMEDGDGDTIFRARADGRFGFGPDGVSSMGAGTFVVGIANSSHTADIAISQRLQHLGDSDTYLDFPGNDTFNLVAGGNSFLKYDNNGNILINNANANVDTKIMGDDGNVILHVDAGINKVGIGTTSPTEVLTLEATEPTILFTENGTDMATIGVNSSDNILIENKTMNKHIVFKVNDQGAVKEGLRLDGAVPEVVVNQTSESLVDFRVESDDITHMLFVDGSENKVGIGQPSPQTTLHVHADSIDDGTVTISQSDNSGDASQLDLSKSRGSGASPAAVQNTDFVGQIRMLGYDGDSYDNFADIYAQAAGTISTTSHPTKVVIRTTAVNQTSPVEAVTIDDNQNVVVAGSVFGKMMHMTHHRYNDGSGTGLEYIPWAGTSEQNSPSWITQGVAPYSGRLVKVWLRSSKSGGTGTTTVGIHTNVDGNTVVNPTPSETVNINMTNANTGYVFNFTSTNHFAAGDVIGVSVDPTNAHGNVNVTCVWEYSITM